MSTNQAAELPSSYRAVHRYDGAVLQHDRRDRIVPCVIQARDFAIVRDVWRYKFLSAPMVHALHWDGGSAWPAQRRLSKLFEAGLVERFRPIARSGSYPWTYHLGERGHAMLRDSGLYEIGARHRRRAVYEFGHVLHELQLNAWALAFCGALGERLVSWEGERDIVPPRKSTEEAQDPLTRADGQLVEGLRDDRERPVRPDAVIEIARGRAEAPWSMLIEFDRTRRVDKNFEKFRRYDTFLTWWWSRLPEALDAPIPYVLFVCQDEEQRDTFVHAADYELTGYRTSSDGLDYVGRDHMLFAIEHDAHRGVLVASRVSEVPRGHPDREDVSVRQAGFDGDFECRDLSRAARSLQSTCPVRGSTRRNCLTAALVW